LTVDLIAGVTGTMSPNPIVLPEGEDGARTSGFGAFGKLSPCGKLSSKSAFVAPIWSTEQPCLNSSF
jgi:hypothetical protein